MLHLLQSCPLCSWLLQENTVDSVPTVHNKLQSMIGHILSKYICMSKNNNEYINDSRGTFSAGREVDKID